MTWEDSRLIQEYMSTLEQSLADMPYSKVKEFLLDIRRHIEEGLERESSLDVAQLLERLGSPQDLAEEFRKEVHTEERIREEQTTYAGIPAWVVLVTLIFVFPIGLILLWFSPLWSRRSKVIATLIPAVGLILFLAIGLGGFYGYNFSKMTFVGAFNVSPFPTFPRPVMNAAPRVFVLMLTVLAVFSPVISVIYLGANLPSLRKRRELSSA